MSRPGETSVAAVFATTMRNRALLRLELAWAAYNGAEWAVYVALLVYAYGIGGATASGLMALVQLIPCIFLAPYLGALTDRRRPGRVLLAAYVLQGTAMAGAAAAMALGAPAAVVFGLAVLINIGITIPRPAQAALLPSVVRAPVELTAANVVSSWMDNGSALVAPALGGLLIALGGPQLSIAVLAVLAFGAAALVWPVPGPPPIAESGGGSLTRQVLHGFKVVWAQKDIRVLVGVLGAQYIFVGALDVLYVVLAISVLGLGQQGAGYLNSAFGAGALVGSMLAALLVARRRLGPALVAGMVTAGLALGALGVFPSVVGAFALLALAGVGRAVMDVTGRILLQRAASPEVLANVFAVLESLMQAGLAIGATLVPVLVGLSGARAALVGTGVVFILIMAVTWRGLRSVDSAADVPHVEIRLLQSIPLFSRLPAPKLEGLARALRPTGYSAGQTVMCEGEPGEFYCAVARGEVEVAHAGQVVAHLTRGEGFGEIALLEDVPRTATVTATEQTEVYCLEKEPFILALTGHAAARTMADGVVARRRDELRLAENGAATGRAGSGNDMTVGGATP
jgi:MFS family permease